MGIREADLVGTGVAVFKISLQQVLSEISKEEPCHLEIASSRQVQAGLHGAVLLSSGWAGARGDSAL